MGVLVFFLLADRTNIFVWLLNVPKQVFPHEQRHLQYHRPCRKLLREDDPIHLCDAEEGFRFSIERRTIDLLLLTVQDHFKSFDCFFEWDEFAWGTGEDFSDLQRRKACLGRENKAARTWKGWERNRWILRARATVNLSSSDNSSIPKIAMISCKDL